MDVACNILFFSDVSNRRIRAVDLATGQITTVAGGENADIGDGGPATEAMFSSNPMRVMADDAGNVYVTDAVQNKIRRVYATTGLINTYAGNGRDTFSGDGGPATLAALFLPHDCRFDRDGNLFIADSHNHRIRRVDGRSGIITTVAGTGREGYSGDNVQATVADLACPLSVDFDAEGNLYIADTNNARIRRVDAATGLISTIAGVGEIGPLIDGVRADEARFARLRDVAVAADGGLIVCDGNNSVVCRIDLAAATIHYVAGTGTAGFSGDGGPATKASVNLPYSICLADQGKSLFIADSCNCRIRRVDTATGTITTIAGNGTRGFFGDGGPAIEACLATG